MTSKKLLSVVLALVFALSLFTALPVSADGLVVTVNGEEVDATKTQQISAVSTVVFTLPTAVLKSAVTLSEQSKATTTKAADGSTVEAYYPWYVRNFTSDLSAEEAKTTVTVEFKRGDISSNSTYKFEFDTDVATEGAEYTFNFTTVPEVDAEDEATVYFAENFSRYTGLVDFGTNSASTGIPNNLDPVRYLKAYVSTSGYTKIDTVDGKPALSIKTHPTATWFHSFGINPKYSGQVNSTSHSGKLTIEFKIPNFTGAVVDFAGIAITTEDGLTWKFQGENGTKIRGWNGQNDIYGTNISYADLGTHTFTTSAEADTWHTLEMVYDTSLTSSCIDTRVLRKLVLDEDIVIWENTNGKSYTFPKPANTYGGFNVGVPFESTQTTSKMSATGLFSVARRSGSQANLLVRYAEYKDYVAQKANVVTTPDASVKTLSQTGTIQYTFDKAMDSTTITNDTVVLEEESKSSAGTWFKCDGAAFASFDEATKQTLTIAFPSGALAPNTNYRVSIKNGLKTLEGGALAAEPETYNFTTDASDGYIVNDNFSRYLTTNYTTANEEAANRPYYRSYGWSTGQIMDIVEKNGEKSLQLSGLNGYKMLSFANAYANQLPASETGYDSVTEFTFTINNSTNASYLGVVEFAGVAIKAVDADTYEFYARTGYQSLNTNAAFDINNYTLIDTKDFESAEAANAKHTLKIVTNTRVVDNHEERILYEVYFGPNRIGAERIGDGIAIATGGYSSTTLGLIGHEAVSGTIIAYIGGCTAASYPVLNLYGFKHAKLVDVVVSGTGSEKTIKVTNRSGEAITGNVVLAAYNGKNFVGVVGLDATETIADGATATVTRKVNAATAGNTYKVMILNSKAALQPFAKAVEGTIQ